MSALRGLLHRRNIICHLYVNGQEANAFDLSHRVSLRSGTELRDRTYNVKLGNSRICHGEKNFFQRYDKL